MFSSEESNPDPVNASAGCGDMLADAGIPALSETDRAALEVGSGIDSRVIASRAYCTVQNKNDMPKFGFARRAGLVPALVVPLYSLDGQTVVHQMRPHNTITNADGKPIKYLTPTGSRAVIDCNPIARQDVLNPEIAIWFVEGAKKADAGISKGLACVSLSGVWNWKSAGVINPDFEHLPVKGRRVYLAFDSDWQVKHSVRASLLRFAAWLRGRGAEVYFILFPMREDGTKTGMDDFFVSGGTKKGLLELAVEELPKPERAGIEINDRQLRDKTQDALNALCDANEPPEVFLRGGRLVRIRTDENKETSIEPFYSETMRCRLARVADWLSTTGADEKQTTRNVSPPKDVVEDVLALREYEGFPVLTGIGTAPLFAADGSLQVEAGYHAQSTYYVQFSGEVKPPAPIPLASEVEQAVSLLLNDMLCDFPFVDPASEAHALAYIIQPFVRPMIDGATPLYLFDAPKAGTGKTLCAVSCARIFTGREDIVTAPETNEEWGKFLLTYLLRGKSHLLLDNVRNLNAPKFFAALTAQDYSDRVLGSNTDVTLPVRVTWSATCNNVTGNEELTRRAVWIRLDAGKENPDERQDFRHPDLKEWIGQNRPRLIHAVLTLVQNWIAQGRPNYSGKNPPMGMFETWTRIIGGILEAAGISGFLDNRTELKQRVDTDSEAWRGFVNAWYEMYEEQGVTCADLFQMAQNWLPDKLGNESERSQRTKLGKLLRSQSDRIYDGKKILRAGQVTAGEHKGSAAYRLQPTESGNVGNMGNLSNPARNENRSLLTEQKTEQRKEVSINEAKQVPYVPHVPLSQGVVWRVTETQKEIADNLAMQRTQGHNHCRKPSEDAGSNAENVSRDFYGLLGELMVRQALEAEGCKFPSVPLVSEKAEPRPDLELCGVTLDVKVSRPKYGSLAINCRQHENKTIKPDFYLPILFEDTEAARVMAPVPYEEVSGWKKAEYVERPFYAQERGRLQPLESLAALIEFCKAQGKQP